jgi:SAM-dependent methyltransferase
MGVAEMLDSVCRSHARGNTHRMTAIQERSSGRFASAVLRAIRGVNAGVRRVAAATHWFQYKAEGGLQGSAEWFDHEVDVHWQWPSRSRSQFLERGVLSALAMGPDDHVLELCCGDGFFTQRFYAPKVASLVALDHNPGALRFARRVHPAANVRYEQADITAGLPPGPFDRIVWDSSFLQFTEDEIHRVLTSAALVLRPGGLFSGHTEIEPGATYSYAKIEMQTPEDLVERLSHFFPHVAVLEAADPVRRNLYFFASTDVAAIPVSTLHPAVVSRSRDPSTRVEELVPPHDRST